MLLDAGLSTCVVLLSAASASAPVCAPGTRLDTSMFSPATAQASSIVELAWLVFGIAAGIFLVVETLIIVAVVRYRRRRQETAARSSGGMGQEPAQVYGAGPIELAWTVVPLILVFVLFLVSARSIHELQRTEPPPGSLPVTVVGHQWWWEFRYPEYGVVTANELHLPVMTADAPRPVALDLRSADVVHSFWVPRLAGKTDVVPNHPNLTWFDPSTEGEYWGQCAEYCGTQHANMRIRVVVESREAFEEWVRLQQAPAVEDESVRRGRELFLSLACVSCHTVAGTEANGTFGPDLTHLMSRARIGAGVAANTPENLKSWVRDPQVLKPGCNMPAMKLSDEEVDLVVEYLLTLQ